MLSLILFLVSPVTSLFNSNPNYHPPKPEPSELSCGLTERQVKRMVGDPDHSNECYEYRSQLVYGNNIMVFNQGHLVGQIKAQARFQKCYDLTTEEGFKSLCEGDK